MAIAMNSSGSDRRQQWRWYCDGQRQLRRNGRRDCGAIAMCDVAIVMEGGGSDGRWRRDSSTMGDCDGHGFILCGTESTKNISTQYKSYGLIDLYQFLHRKCVLPVRCLNLPFHQSTTYISIFCLQTHNPQHVTQNNQNGPLPPYPLAALSSLSMGRAAVPPNLGAASPHGSVAGAWRWVCAWDGWFLCLG